MNHILNNGIMARLRRIFQHPSSANLRPKLPAPPLRGSGMCTGSRVALSDSPASGGVKAGADGEGVCQNYTMALPSMPILLLMAGLLPLAGALVAQFMFYLHPCHFCLLQRYPYVVVVVCGVLAWCWRGALVRALLVAISIYALVVTALLAMIHTGIETKLLLYTGGCVAKTADLPSVEALRQAIAQAPIVACDAVSFTLLGLSMAGWNMLWALLMMAVIVWLYRVERKGR